MGSAHQDLKRAVLGRVGGGGLGLRWQPRDMLASVLDFYSHLLKQIRNKGSYQFTMWREL